ncbi:hypothetical protein A3F00_05510 [Candidatus Daviesbacteria bacterium RIFCSPHIGHO2_12_FULL_37_11]|uniref:Uncharacterized protein n=1 Tax=Candidatus Daviesbacteria bacterium RIFCSPHIGHO2_12_FULL_37_11 TaxID=1797777 RepID=A0A1F5KC43_9BACT|nr:MAG: hypothetical protein A2111_00485 [Candidatus Daviesbacteria bacterium GWA1_38_6]OGE16312.1 MAG: hypothetical protein A2769_04765 [Candidatus Daviesbacteria bacterium RIFCSPHIGHO2_01_FULL_37_27]OGE38507.1 MAG: hypothetical protein A3F00_05510 [Candidatus Daviesbacteria bacterium RIFCSPHIGHO2_12_FULL_37_11]OGE45534.1 MAG: hypothetical protein A3B39_04965 [Candidatus Daviesbacteria bacterium RIFCSPLOWO2_01_FULL_37_10]
MVEAETTALAVIDQSPSKSLVLALTDFRNLVVNPQAVGILLVHPEAIQTAMALAYYRSDLIDVDPKARLGSELKDIREKFPTVINHLTHDVLIDALSEFPSMSWRLEMEKRALAELPEEVREKVTDSELILKLLIEDGGNRNLNMDDYRIIWTSHRFFGELSQGLTDPKTVMLPREEFESFTEIGQRLLITKRMFEVNTQLIDLDYSVKREDSDDYSGIISQMAMLSRIAGTLTASGNPELIKRAKKCKNDLSHLYDTAFMRHPERIPDLKRRFPTFVGIADFKWVEHPGGPDLSRAEQINSRYGGNG